jgi:hypothetical protein
MLPSKEWKPVDVCICGASAGLLCGSGCGLYAWFKGRAVHDHPVASICQRYRRCRRHSFARRFAAVELDRARTTPNATKRWSTSCAPARSTGHNTNAFEHECPIRLSDFPAPSSCPAPAMPTPGQAERRPSCAAARCSRCRAVFAQAPGSPAADCRPGTG